MTRAGVRYAAGALAVAVAAIHIYWGFPRLVSQFEAGIVPDPRPALFVLSGIAILLGLARILDGHDTLERTPLVYDNSYLRSVVLKTR